MPDELERIKQINSSDGRFNRFVSTFRNFVTEEDPFKPAKGRYHLYVAYACPWAHRALIARKLKGLEDIIDVSVTSPNWGPNGWPFYSSDPYPGSTTDPINNAAFVKDLYLKASPSYEGRYTIPVLWDKEQETIVNNESSEILRIFNEGFDGVEGKGESVDLYPKDLRKEIDEVNEWIYEKINNGVYKCGIAKAQEAYDENIGSLFDGLDRVEKLLKESGSEFLVGNRLTEADVRLFTTIIRFDPVYVGHFKCNIRDIRNGYPHINRWMKKLYWTQPAFQSTTNFDHIKRHYYGAMTFVNPNGIVPRGPIPDIEPLKDS